MKSERRAYREIYAFYFFCLFLKKVIKKLLTFCYWIRNIIFNKFEIWLRKRVFYMGIEYREERSGSKIQIFSYCDEKKTGAICALSDGYDWALICDVWADKVETEKKLIREMILKLQGQEIFVTATPDKLDLYEEIGFRRSKNSFTYVGKALSDAQEKELTESGLYLPIGYRYETEFEPFTGMFPVGKKSDKPKFKVFYSDKSDRADYHQVNALLEKAFGGKRNEHVTKDTFSKSQYVQYAYDNETLIGCARAISDGAHALILNVAVDPDYQGLHLGWNIVDKLSRQMKDQNIFLNTHPGGVGFYNQKGFRRNKTALLLQAHEMPDEIKKGFCLPRGYRFSDESLKVQKTP